MKLSEEQIQKLYDFTRQHYVYHYDLQTELVDHLANAIEQEWIQNPNLSFEEALQKEFKKFGIFGFQDVVEQRQNALNKKYNKLVWKHFKDFFKLPKIIMTILCFVVFYKIAVIIPYQDYFIFGTFSIFMVVVFVKMFLAHQKMKAKFEVTKRKWLFEEVIFKFGAMSVFIQLPLNILINVSRFSEENNMPPLYYSLFTVFIYLLFIFGYVILFFIPSKASEYLQQTYPEYKLVNKL